MNDLLQSIQHNGVILMDGGMGQELRARCPSSDTPLWSAQVMLDQPELVQLVHEDYIRAGARVILTNTYATVRQRLDKHANIGDKNPELIRLAGQLAQQARQACTEPVLIAGCLPPLNGSYRPDRVKPFAEIEPIYREHVEILAPYVDAFICETMSSSGEAYAAAHAATTSGKPVWVAWTLKDDDSKCLRSGETITQAWAALEDIPIAAVLANCSAPESISAAMPELVSLGVPLVGGHANGFMAIPAQWTVQEDGIAALGQRYDLDPPAYAKYVQQWIDAGANLVGGCCEVGPAHIRHIAQTILS